LDRYEQLALSYERQIQRLGADVVEHDRDAVRRDALHDAVSPARMTYAHTYREETILNGVSVSATKQPACP
jgi:hypothetical protein